MTDREKQLEQLKGFLLGYLATCWTLPKDRLNLAAMATGLVSVMEYPDLTESEIVSIAFDAKVRAENLFPKVNEAVGSAIGLMQ